MRTNRGNNRLAVLLLVAPSLGTLATAGCADEALTPLPTAEPPASTAPTVDPPPPNPVAKKRTVIMREPFGNVAVSDNLLWDGDFEWASPFSDQYGWIEPPSSPTVSDVVVGPLCISGIKCARLKKNADIVGIAVGSSSKDLVAAIHVRFLPDEGAAMPACGEVEASLLDLGSIGGSEPDVDLLPTNELPDSEGVCELRTAPVVRQNKVYLYVRNRSDFPLILDDTWVRPDSGLLPSPSPVLGTAPPMRSGVPSKLSAVARQRAQDAVLATRLPSDDKPNPTREALQSHKRRVRP